MVDFIVGILNSIGSGVGDDLVADLLKTPAEYNAGMYQLSLTIARSAVKPIASTILAILCVLELARVSTRADGDRELGVKLVAMAMFKLVLVFTAAQHSELMLKAIDEIGEGVMGGIHSAAPTTGSASGLGLGVDPNLAMYLIFPPGLPIAVWGWVRPKGLMPEKYLKYILRHYTQREVYLLDGPGRPCRAGAKPTIKER